MDYTLADEMAALFPSKAVQQYVLDTNWKIRNTAKLVLLNSNDELSLAEKHLWMRRLADRSYSKKLKKQIMEFIETEENLIRQAPENPDHRCIYFLESFREDKWTPECYSTWDAALAEGKSRCVKYKTGFLIRKTLPEDVERREDDRFATYYYNIQGELESITSNLNDYEEFDKNWFEYPNPFERGDIIKTHLGLYGVVQTSQQNWKLMMDRYRKEPRHFDTWGNQIQLWGLVEETGCFHDYYDDYFPYNLEYYTPSENWKEEHGSMDKLLMCASLYIRGEGSLDDLLTATLEYREKRTKGEHLLQVVSDILGQNVWMTRDEILEKASAEDRKELETYFYNVMYDFLESGRAQSISCSDKSYPIYNDRENKELRHIIYEIYYCGLGDKVFSHHWMI